MGNSCNVCIFASFFMLMISIGSEAKEFSQIVFGDSYIRANYLPLGNTTWNSEYYPYEIYFPYKGESYFRISKLRFTDYYTLTEQMSLLNLQYQDFGYNYASGSTGILSETGTNFGETVTMTDQINLFKHDIRTTFTTKYKTKANLRHFLSNSIYVIHVGTLDYINNYLWDDKYKRSQYNPHQFARLLVTELENYLKGLYELGARKMLVFEILPIGCLPRIVNQMKLKHGCSEKINHMASIFNYKLGTSIKHLNETLSGSIFAIGKQYDFILDMVKNPHKYGMINARQPYCAVKKDGTGLCEPVKFTGQNWDWENEPKSIFFDSVHLGLTPIKIMARSCFNSTDLCVPNLSTLANLKL